MKAGAAALLLLAAPAAAEVTAVAPNGFVSDHVATVAVPPAEAFAALTDPARWWDGAHTYSGTAASLSLDPVAGGCFCERWAGGAVEHGRVVLIQPDRMLRLAATLGPLQAEGVAGALSWSLKPVPGGTEIRQTYVVGGFVRGGAEAYAAPVDAVMGIQLRRLAALFPAR